LLQTISISICVAKVHVGLAEREILALEYGYYVFQNPPYMASRELLIKRIAITDTSFSPLQCHARHGYMVTIAHRVEVEVGAHGPASAPLSGAAVATSPAGAAMKEFRLSFSIGKKYHASLFSASALSNFNAFHLRTTTKIGAAIDIVATKFADSYIVHVCVTVSGQTLKYAYSD
jgi:hypothetical protein